MTRLLIPALAVLSACAIPLPIDDCKPVALPDTPRLHVVAAEGPSPSPSPNEGDNAELFRPAQCVGPIQRKGE